MTVLFADLVGFTTRAEQLDPEDVRAMLVPYYARLRSELERFGGTVEKFIGDAVMALFGAPVAHEDDPERAVRAALAIRKSIADLNEASPGLDLHLRIGINTGEALVVLGARPSEGEGMAAGDVINTAARLQANAPVDGIIVSEATHRATAQAIEYREREPVVAKGKARPIPVWEAIAATQPAGRRAMSGAPLVGRGAEFAQLAGLWREVVAGRRPRVATVLGAPGLGKSRLLAEFSAPLREHAAVYVGRCLPYGDGITYWPVSEIIKDAAAILHSDEPATVSAKLAAFLEQLRVDDAEALRTMAAACATLTASSVTSGGASAVEITQAELHWGIRRIFESLAGSRPLVLLLEDLHWAEPTLLELMAQVVEKAEGPILMLGSARPELADSSPAILASARGRIELRALDAGESEALLHQLLDRPGFSPRVAERILRGAGGNPLFLEETVRMLSDAGMLDAGEASAVATLEAVPVAGNLQSLIGSRLDRLPAPNKRVAQHASVVGAAFWPGAVSYLQGANRELARSLDALERRNVIRAQEVSTVGGEREYAFTHILIRDVAYGQLPKARRAALHVRCAQWIEALPGSTDDVIEIVAYHLEQACRIARDVGRISIAPPLQAAIEALSRAGEKAERRQGMREADRFYVRALELAGEEHAALRADLELRRGGTLKALGELRDAATHLGAAAEWGASLGRPDLRCNALIALANVDWKQGRAADARGRLGEAAAIASEIGDRGLEVRVAFEATASRAHFEGAVEAVNDLRRAVALAEEIEDRALRTEGYLRLGTFLFNLGRLSEAERELESFLSLVAQKSSRRDEARATFLLALIKYYRGQHAEAETLALQAAEWLERTGDSYFVLQNWRSLAIYALARGDPRLAEERLRGTMPLAVETGGWLLVELRRLLVEALVRQGRLGDARDLLAEMRANVPAEDVYARAAVLLAEAGVATAEADRASAIAGFEQSLALLEEQQLVVDLGEAQLAFARALRRFAEQERARRTFERVRQTLAPTGATWLLAEIERELAEMAAEAGVAGPRGSS